MINLNADLVEGFDQYKLGDDEATFELVLIASGCH
jgi:lactam utilization protein B